MKKGKYYLITALSSAILLISPTASARTWVEVGTEYEAYFDETDKGATYNYERLTSNTPYLRFSHSPDSNEWNVWGRVFQKQYLNEDLFPDSTSTSMTDRVELHYTKTIKNGDFRFRPGIGFRYNGYKVDRYETEFRAYPQMDYFINSQSRLFFSGHVYVGASKSKRMSDQQAENYTDWGYESEFGLIHRFADGSSIKPHLYTEYDEFENNYDVNYWQARLIYTKKIGRVTINPFIRYGLNRTVTERSHTDPERWGISKDANYSRAGVYGNVGISGKWNFIYETYYQQEVVKAMDGAQYPDRDKAFVKIGIQRHF